MEDIVRELEASLPPLESIDVADLGAAELAVAAFAKAAARAAQNLAPADLQPVQAIELFARVTSVGASALAKLVTASRLGAAGQRAQVDKIGSELQRATASMAQLGAVHLSTKR